MVEEEGTKNEILTVERPCTCPIGSCKCCCFQSAKVSFQGEHLGDVTEVFYFCVPRFVISDSNMKPMYKLHQPTCCNGGCVDCCAEGNPCGKGCCKVPFHIYPHSQADTEGKAPYIGKILRKRRDWTSELFTDADAFELDAPEGCTNADKAVLIGTTLFINANFFEGGQE